MPLVGVSARGGLIGGEFPRLGGFDLVSLPFAVGRAGRRLDLRAVEVAERLRHERLGRIRARDLDLLSARLEALEPVQAQGLRELTGTGAGPARHAAGPRDDARHGGAREQQQAAEEHQHREDVGAETLEERRGGPIEGFACGAPVHVEEAMLEVPVAGGMLRPEPGSLRRKAEQQRREQQHGAGVQRAGCGKKRAHDERPAPARQRERNDVSDSPGGRRQRALQPLPHRSAVPAAV